MYVKKGIISGTVAGIIFFFLDLVIDVLFGGTFASFYNGNSSMLSLPDMQTFILQKMIFSLFLGVLMGLTFSIFYTSIPRASWMKGLNYGFLFYLISGVLSFFQMYILIPNIPQEMIAQGLVSGLIKFLIVGVVLAMVYDSVR